MDLQKIETKIQEIRGQKIMLDLTLHKCMKLILDL